MALFAITRYFGEDKVEEQTHKADAILKKLQADAEARKRQRELGAGKSPLDNSKNIQKKKDNEDKTPKSAQKKQTVKRSKLKDFDDAKSVGEVTPKKKKKKNLDKNVTEEGNGSDNTNNEKLNERDSVIDNEPNSNDIGSEIATSKSKFKVKSKSVLENEDGEEEEDVSGSAVEDNKVDEPEPMEDTQEGAHEFGGFTVLGDYKSKQTEKVSRVLPDWLASPNVIASDLKQKTTLVSEFKGLDPDIHKNLKENQIDYFFPVQMQVIPEILSAIHHGFVLGRAGFRPRDLCVSAPTGSGKTLAYVLPIVQALKNRVVCRIRAMVVLPVRDLAAQVFKVFLQYTKGTNLKVGMIVGQKQFSVEQHALVRQRLGGLESKVDIVVATPGRLVDHINKTPGFSLAELRFLVIDEADRIMEHVKQDWLSHVENAAFSGDRQPPSSLNVHNSCKQQMPLQKLLFSATLSQNPEKLQQLNLFQPRLFTSVVDNPAQPKTPRAGSVEMGSDTEDQIKDRLTDPGGEVKGQFVGKYTTPLGLKEYTVEVDASEKPLVILHFLHNLGYRHVLCFTNSVESTHRLYHLIRLYGNISAAEITAKLQASRRKKVLSKFQNGSIDVLICSDAMARGMDIDNVQYVISYDPPPYIKTYIHRVGRTARAGKEGIALTLLQKKEFHHFKTMTKDAGKTNIEKMRVQSQDMEGLLEKYQSALQQLPQVLKNEKFPKR
ncbi:ATP-dependent RNA helicase DDX51-like [Crassostrea virginica]